MSAAVTMVDPVADGRWDRFVMSHEDGTIYHHSIWKELINQTYGYAAYFLALEDTQREISGILPLFHIKSRLTGDRFVSLPFAHICGPLSYSATDTEKLVEYAVNLAQTQKCDYLEIRIQDCVSEISNPDLVKHQYFSTFILELSPDSDALWSRIKKQRTIQYGVKKARKSGISISLGESLSDLEVFYELNLITRKKHGMPPQPLSFFENLWKLLGAGNMIKLLIAEHNGERIAGIVLFVFKNTVIYAYGASQEKYLYLCANHLLLWEAIQWACKSGYQYFDFGRTSPDNEGLWNFKKRWGTVAVPITHYYWPDIAGPASTEENSIKYRIATNLWRRFPTRLSRSLAPWLYRHLG